MSDDNIKPIPVKFKKPPGDEPPFLKVIHYDDKCNHRYHFVDDGTGFKTRMVNATYYLREGETEVECGICNT